MKNFILIIALCFAVCCTTFASCRFNNKESNVKTLSVLNDSLNNNMGDSIGLIMLRANHISAKTLSPDTLQTLISLDKAQTYLLKFLLAGASDYHSNTIVYGVFSPAVSIRLAICKHRYVDVLLDFGLKKIKIVEKDQEDGQTFDLQNGEIVRLCRLLFPENPHIDFFYQEYMKSTFVKKEIKTLEL